MPEYIHPKAVDAALQPEAQNVQHLFDDFGIAPVEVGLFAQEGMVVVLLRMRVVFPSASTKARQPVVRRPAARARTAPDIPVALGRSEEHTSELQSHVNLVCRLLLEKKKKITHPPLRTKTKNHKNTHKN